MEFISYSIYNYHIMNDENEYFPIIPDLSKIEINLINTFPMFLCDTLPKNIIEKGLVFNFIRISDSAAFEFESGRISIQKYYSGPYPNGLLHMKALEDFENCICNTQRCFQILKSLKNEYTIIPLEIREIASSINKETKEMEDTIRLMRDIIQHIGTDISLEGILKNTKRINLQIEKNFLSFIEYEISYNDLANCIMDFKKIGKKMINFYPKHGPPIT